MDLHPGRDFGLAMASSRGRENNGKFIRASVLSVSREQFHRIAFTEWGQTAKLGPVICVHGLTRQGRDFDYLADTLATGGYRVICPDLVGRGLSDHLTTPEDYDLPQYVVDMTVLISSLGASQIDFIGTSLGGLIGIVMAGMPRSPIRRLVINDIGPRLPLQAVQRIGRYVRDAPPRFASAAAAEAYFREILAPFGRLPDWQWRHLTEHSVMPDGAGGYRLRYDRRLVKAFKPPWAYTRKLWSFWDRIRCPVLVMRGAESDLLDPKTAAEMARRGPRAKVVELPDCGHAPSLLGDAEIKIVMNWLAEHEPEETTAAPTAS